MDYRKIEDFINPKTIGKKVKFIRKTMSLTKLQFSERTIGVSEEDLSKLEKTENNDEIGLDMLLKMYYMADRILEELSERYILDLAKGIKDDIIKVIESPK